MLFNSSIFIFLFLPIVLFGYYKIKNHEASLIFLVFASLFFYGWWNPAYLILIIISMIINFYLGNLISRNRKKVFLIIGVVTNLLAIAYFKYAGFLVMNLSYITGSNFSIEQIILPLAISFFTFQQIAYLVDAWYGETKEYSFLKYSLFVTFFPQLIAGPIVHHKEMLPQFNQVFDSNKINLNLSIGISIFAIGLFKKTVIADPLATYANPIFLQADSGVPVDFFMAWLGTITYSLQLYFDFSGYSDMAIGLARMFGIVLPLNFYSPYKSFSIIEFWHRWHMTLSRFLRDYIYIPLGGNRKGKINKFVFLMITMLLGGMWHGAGWSFIIWGALHGIYLIINHVWISMFPEMLRSKIPNFFYWFVTIFAVMIGWIFFRAITIDGAVNLINGLFGNNGYSLPNAIMVRLGELANILEAFGVESYNGGGGDFILGWLICIVVIPVALFAPNIQDIFKNYGPTFKDLKFNNGIDIISKGTLVWSMSYKWAIVLSICLLIGLMTLGQVSDFLYFQF